MFLFYSTVPIILKVDHCPLVDKSMIVLKYFAELSLHLVVSDMRGNHAEPLTSDLGHVGRSNPYLCLPWESLCTPIPFPTRSSLPCLNWADGSKLWASAGWLDVLRCFRRHGSWPRHLLIQVLCLFSCCYLWTCIIGIAIYCTSVTTDPWPWGPIASRGSTEAAEDTAQVAGAMDEEAAMENRAARVPGAGDDGPVSNKEVSSTATTSR